MAGTAPHRHVVLGRVHGLFGVRGWVKVYSYTRPAEAILDYDRWWIGNEGARRCYQVVDGRVQGKTLVARLADDDGQPLPDRDAAVELLDLDIAVERADMPDPEPGEYYWFDLIGLKVVTVDDIDLGQVKAMMETGANDVLVVQGDRERLIPLVVDEYVMSVDLEAGVMTVDWDPDF
ncbi:ribosome maturation factor RimM [Salinisphaera hydrothermalis]|uniref:Ribosome maturation factor RimM n=1 Tax=Salinisphaera hydrothermalis (strain C41B8) TaxID=1304275 RepID=A0A084IH07_SALHC|nr:ribosome maturation factor RimM [Salinisphaera hydrothermalis]KEZ75991.1 16S rRNA processing protein RimM [Salinisphaera hydrothermalis C41B8]